MTNIWGIYEGHVVTAIKVLASRKKNSSLAVHVNVMSEVCVYLFDRRRGVIPTVRAQRGYVSSIAVVPQTADVHLTHPKTGYWMKSINSGIG
jgi:hypothetical protein